MSREIPYSPAPKPPGPSFDHMQAILDKHAQRLGAGQTAKQDSDEPKTARSDQQGAPGLVWAPKVPGTHHIDEITSRYRISGAKVNGKPRYSAWKRSVVPGSLPDALGCVDTPDEAKQLCATHAAAQAQSVKS